ncbi:MAG: GNAT family N-acetyltransferase [Candidatus Nitrosoglobus sp.]
MSRSIKILRKRGGPAKRIGQSMARAFRDEPNFAYILPNQDGRERALAWFFGSFVAQLGLCYGKVYIISGGAGGAVWIRPGVSLSLWKVFKAGLFAMPFHFGIGGTRRSISLSAYLQQVRQEIAPPFHWYLFALGIDPAEQGQGLGRVLLKPVLARADADGVPCYLETFQEQTTSFYRQFGFKVIRTDVVPRGGPPFWCMMRESHTLSK